MYRTAASASISFRGIPVLWVGEPRSHVAAEIHLWKKIQEFLRTHLSCDVTSTKAKLQIQTG